ncbi:alpha-N-acetylglucosaminidase-like [Chelonus insularis]|uniref:alpha-N-acetylglucosaminidase-like n=1 Tax=Chelonus insularis TaxID=460826 RepID=UPI00158C9BB0|nr:alpha-N-acetylglucosaminidase-like [Chelonus insularis]
MSNYQRILFSYVLLVNLQYFISAQNTISDQFQLTLGHIKPSASNEQQTKAAEELIQRIIGTKANLFKVLVDPTIGPEGKDTFKLIKCRENKIWIIGTSGVSVAWGFHYYLKNYCNSQIAWEGVQIQFPSVLPEVNETITSNDRFRYYQNVVTAGYSTPWWNWDKWERNIDWMALNGINLVLAFGAQEAIWERIYLKLNLTREEIDQHFAGPAYLPWGRMGNIRGWGGPLTSSWHNFTINLQHKILNRMRQLGITPVLPAFSGHVPQAFLTKFPNASMYKTNTWYEFPDEYCCPVLLSPRDPLFKVIGKLFLDTYTEEFGTDHVYNCDTFNEKNPETDLDVLRDIGRAIYSAMTDVDPQAIWILQGWTFNSGRRFWTKERIKAFITSVPLGKMVILDLESEQLPLYNKLDSYYGQPFIWCMLHNFGAKLGMYGSAYRINERVIAARKMNGSTMIGTGLTPEGINQDYVMYDLMSEMAYRHEPVDLDSWFEQYSVRRYGVRNKDAAEAWKLLEHSVYHHTNETWRSRRHYILTNRPSLEPSSYILQDWFEPSVVIHAWRNLLNARLTINPNSLYKYDVIDFTRQSLQVIVEHLYKDILEAYKQKNRTEFRIQSGLFQEIFDDLDKILSTSEVFLLGTWIRDARLLGTNDKERDLYEFNARRQITLWGPASQGKIIDYATKQWAGVVTDYFGARWKIFLSLVESSIPWKNTTFDQTKINDIIYEFVEKPFSEGHNKYPTDATGDPIQVAVDLYNKWSLRNPMKRFLENLNKPKLIQ